MVTIGIDPGTANTGFGVVRSEKGRMIALDGGVVSTRSDAPLGERLLAIHSRVSELIVEHSPDAMAVEDLYFGRNVSSALAVGQARGAILLAAAQAAIPCRSYTPQQIKAAVCGSGRAEKAQVASMVQRLLSLAEIPTPDHAADALAAAICHCAQVPALEAVR